MHLGNFMLVSTLRAIDADATREGPSLMRMTSLAFAGLIIAAPAAQCATYYVDSQLGDNNNSGLSSASAWKTLGKVALESSNRKLRKNGFAAGDQILFRRGQTFESKNAPVI